MVQRSPTYSSDVAGDAIDYKPLSLMAVAGVLVAALYLAMIAIGGVASFYKGEPFFMGGWSAALPIGGAALSGLALWQIYSSEGTRAGARLAKWGLGICVVAGLGYFTYQEFTALAIVQQANRFVMEKDEQSGFFPRLQGSDVDVHASFLLSLDGVERAGASPTNSRDLEQRFDLPAGNNPKGRLTQFLEHPLVHLIRFAGPSGVQVEPQAVLSWGYEAGAYHVVRPYRVTTEEGIFEVAMTVSSMEPAGEGEKRQWKVEPILPTSIQIVKRTDAGAKRQLLRQKSADFVAQPRAGWLALLRDRDDMEVYVRTQPLERRKELRQRAEAIRAGTPFLAVAGAAMAPLAATIESDLLARQLPGYHPLDRAFNYFKMDAIRIWDRAYLENVTKAAKAALSTKGLPNLWFKWVPDEFAQVEVKNGDILVTQLVEIKVLVESPKSDKGEVLKGECLLSVKFVVAAPEALDPTTSNSESHWQIKSAEIVRVLPLPIQK